MCQTSNNQTDIIISKKCVHNVWEHTPMSSRYLKKKVGRNMWRVWEINVKMESKYHFEKIESEVPGGFSDTPLILPTPRGWGHPPHILSIPRGVGEFSWKSLRNFRENSGISRNFPRNFRKFWLRPPPLQGSSKWYCITAKYFFFNRPSEK